MDIRKARELKGMTRQQLANWLEIPYKSLEKWEQGTRKCPVYVEKMIIEKILDKDN